jgi:hypothetical protein
MLLTFLNSQLVVRRSSGILLLLTAMLLASCAPSLPAQEIPVPIEAIPTLTDLAPSTESMQSVPLPSITARGPDLEASDPASVSLASGGLQLVEFFRFT